jgi:hypothetical protein
MKPTAAQRRWIDPGVWLVRMRQRKLARWWFAFVTPIIASLEP